MSYSSTSLGKDSSSSLLETDFCESNFKGAAGKRSHWIAID